jgi:HK97 family phage portal protein
LAGAIRNALRNLGRLAAQATLPTRALSTAKNPLPKPYSQHAWVYGCIRSNSRKVAKVPLKFYRGDVDDPTEIREGPLYNVFHQPNTTWSLNRLIEATVINLELCGNALWLLQRNDEKSIPRRIWCFGRSRFTPHFYKDSDEIKSWTFHNGHHHQEVAPYHVLHFSYYDPDDDFWGIGPMAAARQGAEADVLADRFNRAFFDNAARPGGVVTVKDADDVQFERTKASIQDRLEGIDNIGGVLYLAGEDVKYSSEPVSHLDMAWAEQKGLTEKQIRAIFGTPPTKLGNFDAVHKATARSVDRMYYEDTLIPIMDVIASMLIAQFFMPLDEEETWAAFDVNSIGPMHEDYNERLDQGLKLQTLGYPPNDINERLELGMPEVPWGDVGRYPIGLLPADQDPLAEIEPPEGNNGEKTIVEVVERPRLVAPVKRSVEPHSERHLALYALWRAATKGPEDRFRKGMKQYFNGCYRHVRNKINEFSAGIDLTEDLLRQTPIDDLLIGPAFDTTLKSIARDHYYLVGDQIGSVITQHIQDIGIDYTFDLADPRFVQELMKKELKIVGVNDVTKAEVRYELVESAKATETVSELQQRLVGHKAFNQERALKVARTETGGAANVLEFKAQQIAGVTKHQWLAQPDEVARETHLYNMTLGAWPIGKPFPNGLRFPMETGAPAGEVVNCRCSTIAVE